MLLLYLLTVALALPNHRLFAMGSGEWTVVKMLGVACLLYSLVAALIRQRWPNPFSTVPGCFAFAYVAVSGLSSVIRDIGPQNGLGFLFKELAVLMLLVSTILLLHSASRMRTAVLVLLGAMGVASLYVIRQFLQFRDVYSGFRTFGGVSGDPNYYSLAVVLSVPTCVLWAISNRRPKMERLYCACCLAPICLGFVLSGSRGGFLGLAAALATLWLRMELPVYKKLLGAVVVATVLAASAIFPSSPLHRILAPSRGDQESSESRLVMWRAGMQMFAEDPVFGIGFSRIPDELARLRGPSFNVLHNTYVEAAAGLGLAGLITFIGLLLTTIYSLGAAVRRIRRARRETLADLATGLQSGLVGYCVCALFLSTWWYMMVWLVISIALSILYLSNRLPRRRRKWKQRSAALAGETLEASLPALSAEEARAAKLN